MPRLARGQILDCGVTNGITTIIGEPVVRGYFDNMLSWVIFELDFLPSEGEWKPIMLHVNVKAAGEG